MKLNQDMMRVGLGACAALICATSVSALSREADRAREKLSQYELTGETTSCVNLRQVRDTDALDDYSMLVEVGRTLYLNELNGRCIGLEREQRYVRSSPQARMCSGDIIRVVDSFGDTYGSCSLGDFKKLKKIEEVGGDE